MWDGARADLIWDSGGKQVLAWKTWIHGEEGSRRGAFTATLHPQAVRPQGAKAVGAAFPGKEQELTEQLIMAGWLNE